MNEEKFIVVFRDRQNEVVGMQIDLGYEEVISSIIQRYFARSFRIVKISVYSVKSARDLIGPNWVQVIHFFNHSQFTDYSEKFFQLIFRYIIQNPEKIFLRESCCEDGNMFDSKFSEYCEKEKLKFLKNL